MDYTIKIVLVVFSAAIVITFIYIGVPWIYGKWAQVTLKRKAKKCKALALTFDDGPGTKLTPLILDILAEHNVKATFFLLGRNIPGREAIVKQIAHQGHQICSHGYDHLNYWKVSPIRAIRDIKRGWQAINDVLNGKQDKYAFRPPYGKLSLPCMLYLWFHRVPILYWTLVSGDTWPEDKRDSRRLASLVRKSQGAVMLAHDFDRTSRDTDRFVLECLKQSLSAARESSMTVATVSELTRNSGRC